MSQKDAWEREYKNPKLVQGGTEPRTDVKEYIKFLRKREGVELENLSVLDIGSGTGKHANYLAEQGSEVVGLEISKTALETAKERARDANVSVDYREADIGKLFPLESESFDLALDVMSSTTLTEKEREGFLKETHRVLKPDGHFFVRALCKDGDKNAKRLLTISPGTETDTYIHKELGLTERVFTEGDFRELYSTYFEIQKLTKKTNYTRFNGQPYKRNYWLAYLRKT